MAHVHPTAIVSDAASLAETAEIGPWCVIDGEVAIGEHTRLSHRVSLKGPLTLGPGNQIYPNAAIGYEPQDRKYDPDTPGAGIVVGRDNILREGVTIHRATGDRPTTLGDHNYLMANSHVAHDCTVGSHCMFANGALLAGHVAIADHVILGGNAVVHQFCRVGRLSMIAGIRGVTRDLPPFCVVYDPRRVGSLNIVGLRRAGYRRHIDPLNKAFKVLYRQNHTMPVALARIRNELGDDPLVGEFADFIDASERGITLYASSRNRGADSHAPGPSI